MFKTKPTELLIFIDLQAFADNEGRVINTTTDTKATTGNDLSAEMKTFYDSELIEQAGPELVHDQFAVKKPIPKGNGKTIEFRKYDPLPKAETPLTEGVTPSGKALNVTTITSEVHQYGDYVALTDMLDMTAIDNNIAEAVQLLGKQAGQTLDTVTRNAMQSGTNVIYAPTVADGIVTEIDSRSSVNRNSLLTVDVVKRAAATLRGDNVPKIDGNYVAIIHPFVAHDLMSDPKWEDYHQYAEPENLYSGEIGRIGGVRFVESTEAKIYGGAGSGGDSVYGCLFFGKGAYATTEITGGGLQTIVKQLGSGGVEDALNQRSSVGWKATKTAEILIEPYILRVECGSKFAPDAASN